MPTLPELLSRLQFIGYETALLGLLLTGGIILVVRDWRLLILALLGQYILVGLILSRLVRPDIAVLGVLIGAFICPILFLSARQVSVTPVSIGAPAFKSSRYSNKYIRWLRNLSLTTLLLGPEHRRISATGHTFRIFMAVLLILIAITLSESIPLQELDPVITTAVYWLVLAGLGVLMITEDPMKAGHGLFTVLTGFGLYYFTLKSSLLLTGLWGTVNLLLALSIGYLTVVRGTGPEKEL